MTLETARRNTEEVKDLSGHLYWDEDKREVTALSMFRTLRFVMVTAVAVAVRTPEHLSGAARRAVWRLPGGLRRRGRGLEYFYPLISMDITRKA